jgi:hypothetical protein
MEKCYICETTGTVILPVTISNSVCELLDIPCSSTGLKDIIICIPCKKATHAYTTAREREIKKFNSIGFPSRTVSSGCVLCGLADLKSKYKGHWMLRYNQISVCDFMLTCNKLVGMLEGGMNTNSLICGSCYAKISAYAKLYIEFKLCEERLFNLKTDSSGACRKRQRKDISPVKTPRHTKRQSTGRSKKCNKSLQFEQEGDKPSCFVSEDEMKPMRDNDAKPEIFKPNKVKPYKPRPLSITRLMREKNFCNAVKLVFWKEMGVFIKSDTVNLMKSICNVLIDLYVTYNYYNCAKCLEIKYWKQSTELQKTTYLDSYIYWE